jgi:tRNA nucleotidyltransferase (CCA-adding enzyme)
VGGCIRDTVLDAPAGPDIDLAVEGDGSAFAYLLAAATSGSVIAEHAFGTSTLLVDLGEGLGVTNVDVAACRTERYLEPGALPSVMLGATIEQDLARRDVTVNALAVALEADADGMHRLVDEHGGIDDLAAGVLRVLHDDSFVDDPTRIFRVARYAGRAGLRVDESTRALATAAVADGALATISADRMRTELQLVLAEPAWNALTLLSSWGVTSQLDPRLDEALRPPLLLRSIDDACGIDPERNRRAWTLRLTALVRPLGPEAGSWMRWLGLPGDVIGPVQDHLRLLDAALTRGSELRVMANSELYLELGDVADESLALAALAISETDHVLLERLVTFAAAAQQVRLTVRGDDVIAAGVPAGPRVGRILGDLFLRSLDGELQGEADERCALAQLVDTVEGE